MAKRRKQQSADSLQEDMKRLMILGLIAQGVRSKDIAAVLGVHPSVITRMIPARGLSKYRQQGN